MKTEMTKDVKLYEKVVRLDDKLRRLIRNIKRKGIENDEILINLQDVKDKIYDVACECNNLITIKGDLRTELCFDINDIRNYVSDRILKINPLDRSDMCLYNTEELSFAYKLYNDLIKLNIKSENAL